MGVFEFRPKTTSTSTSLNFSVLKFRNVSMLVDRPASGPHQFISVVTVVNIKINKYK